MAYLCQGSLKSISWAPNTIESQKFYAQNFLRYRYAEKCQVVSWEIFRAVPWLLTLIGKCPGYGLEQFLENSSNRQFYNFGAWHRPTSGKLIQIWMLAHALIFTKTEFHRILMDYFSRNRPSSCPENWNFEEIMDEFSRNRSVSHPEKLKFQKKFWMSFPGFANKD